MKSTHKPICLLFLLLTTGIVQLTRAENAMDKNSPLFVNGTNQPKSIMVTSTIFKLPAAQAEKLIADYTIFAEIPGPTPPDIKGFLGQHPGVRFLGSPRTVCASGIEAKLQTTKSVKFNGTNVDVGMFLNILPTLAPDSSITIKTHLTLQEIGDGTPQEIRTDESDLQIKDLKPGETTSVMTPVSDRTSVLVLFIKAQIVNERLEKIVKKAPRN